MRPEFQIGPMATCSDGGHIFPQIAVDHYPEGVPCACGQRETVWHTCGDCGQQHIASHWKNRPLTLDAASINTLNGIADGLDQAVRQGGGEDVPEGNRYIVLSDTIARRMAETLRLSPKDRLIPDSPGEQAICPHCKRVVGTYYIGNGTGSHLPVGTRCCAVCAKVVEEAP